MTTAPFHNRESFTRAVGRLVERADSEGRGDDLDRVVSLLKNKPREVTALASLMMLLDEDYRLLLHDEIEAFGRWGKQRGRPFSDEEIFVLMMSVYENHRSGLKLDDRT